MPAPSTWSLELQAPSFAGLPSLLRSASSWGRRVEDDVGGPYGPGSLHFLWPELSHVAARGSVIHLCAHEEKEMGFGNIGLSFDFPSSVPQPYSACTWGRETREGR